VAGGLARYGDAHGLSEENAATAWGRATAGLDLVPHLDPYLGRMDGIGVALFTYMRMLCGADTLKPDVRSPTLSQAGDSMLAGERRLPCS
jgi:hypothetical protein